MSNNSDLNDSLKKKGNPFVSVFSEKFNELLNVAEDSDSIIEIVTRSIALIIILICLGLLLPTVGVLLNIYETFRNLTIKTYNKLKNVEETDKRFPILIELAIYTILTFPFLVLLIPYWIIAEIVVWCSQHVWFTIIVGAIIAAVIFFIEDICYFIKTIN